MHGEFRPGGMEREWCDTNVLRVLRRRSLAALRHEIEPVDAATFARFLPAWQGVGRGRRGLDALVETLEQLQGVAIPASVLERDVLPARVEGYRAGMLDELCAAGEIVWVGAGPLGADDGRVRIYFRDRVRLLAPAPIDDGRPAESVHDALRTRLAQAGASFWPDLVAAAGTADDTIVLAALWDLVWAGEVTNDTFGPLRVPRRAVRRSASARAKPHLARLTRLGPPAGAGRWSLVAPLLEPAPTPTEIAHAQALQLLERHGVVTREGVRAEGVAGGFAAVYPVLRALEESGRARRGWFVAGLGAAQFALPGAVDRLRAYRTDRDRRTARGRARGHRPGPAVRRRARLARQHRAARRVPRARTWCSSTATSPRTSSAAGSRSSRSAERHRKYGRPRSSRRTKRAASRGFRSSASTTNRPAPPPPRPRCATRASPTGTGA